jgi:nucleotide-binding universal stress UspA family protein
MLPQPLTNAVPRGTSASARILIAVDDAERSARALDYVGTLLRDARDVQVTLLHVLKPMPRELLEHGGSEDPEEELRLATKLHREQEDWLRTERARELPILMRARDLLAKTGFPPDRVMLTFGHGDNIAHNIVVEARTGRYGTIVVSRHGPNGMKRFFRGGITDQLSRDLSGYTLWIVE